MVSARIREEISEDFAESIYFLVPKIPIHLLFQKKCNFTT
jgi:hypothetical protein